MPHAPYIEEFLEFLSIPSVSASPEHKLDIERAAQWLKARMERAGIQDAEVIPTAGHPVVYGLAAAAESGAPTVLIYGHYDTQPEDPLDEWVTEPFKPEVRDGKVFARGAADNKGGVLPAIVAIEKALARGGLRLTSGSVRGEEEMTAQLKPCWHERPVQVRLGRLCRRGDVLP